MTTPTLFAAREGFHAPGAEAFYQRSVLDIHLFGIDLSINRTVLLLFLATLITIGLFGIAFSKPKLVPRGLQNFMELIVDFVKQQIVMPAMGPSGLSYLPYLTTVFFFVLVCNLFEVIPGINFPPMSRFGIPLMLALCFYVLFIAAGIKARGVGKCLKYSLVPSGVPLPALLFLVPLELVSVFVIRPATLAIRLMANMIAGHLLLTVLFLGTAYLLGRPATIPFGVLSAGISAVMVGFEIFVAALQAFIFTMLTAVYIAGSKESAH